MTVGELFAGIGGIGLGLERAGMSLNWQVEIDQRRRSVLEYHWPDMLRMEDVCEVKGSDLTPVDIITGGFPCQDISVAGRREGLAGKRSGLFYEFMRIVGECSPRWILIENVDGLRSSNERRDMGTVFGALGDLNYWWTSRVLDSQYFGVPQRRRRVFIVGHLGGPCRPEVLLESESLSRDPEKVKEARQGIARALTASAGKRGADKNDAGGGRIVTGAVSAKFAKGSGGPAGDEAYNLVAFHGSQDPCTDEDAFYALGRNQGQEACIFDPTQITSPGNRSKPEPGGPSHSLVAEGYAPAIVPTLGKENYSPTKYPSGQQIDFIMPGCRRLTPRECERLQGFPDDWTRWGADGEEISDSARYKMIGDAVTVPVAEWIGRRIMEVYEEIV